MYVYDIITSVYLKKADLLCVCNYHPWGGELKWEGKCRTPVSELFLSIPVSLPLFLLSSPSSLTFSLSLTPSLCDALFICFIRSFFLSQQTENFWLYVKKINLVWFDHLFWSYILFQQWKKKVNRNHGQVIEETVERSVWRRDWKSVTANENCHRRLSQQKSFKKDHWILTQKLHQGHQLPIAFQLWNDTYCFLANNNYFETIFTIPYLTFKVFHSLFYLPPWMHKILIVLCLWLPQY